MHWRIHSEWLGLIRSSLAGFHPLGDTMGIICSPLVPPDRVQPGGCARRQRCVAFAGTLPGQTVHPAKHLPLAVRHDVWSRSTMTATHPFARLKSVSLEKVAAEPLVGFRRKDYSEYYRIIDRIFAPIRDKPRIAVEWDS